MSVWEEIHRSDNDARKSEQEDGPNVWATIGRPGRDGERRRRRETARETAGKVVGLCVSVGFWTGFLLGCVVPSGMQVRVRGTPTDVAPVIGGFLGAACGFVAGSVVAFCLVMSE